MGRYIYSKAKKFNSACVSSAVSIHIIWEFPRCGLQEKTELLILSFYFVLIGNGKVVRLYLETHAALPQLAWAGESHFSVFLHSERWKTGNCSFTAVPIGGKVDFPAFLRSERRKTGNCRYAAGTYGGNLSIRFFILSSLLLLVGGSWVEA